MTWNPARLEAKYIIPSSKRTRSMMPEQLAPLFPSPSGGNVFSFSSVSVRIRVERIQNLDAVIARPVRRNLFPHRERLRDIYHLRSHDLSAIHAYNLGSALSSHFRSVCSGWCLQIRMTLLFTTVVFIGQSGMSVQSESFTQTITVQGW